MWTHGEAGSSALLFQIIPFSSECSITLSFCPDLSSLPHRTLVSSWPPWGGFCITSRKAAGSRPGEVTDSLQRAVRTPSVVSKATGPGNLAGPLLLMLTHKHRLLPWGFLRLLLCRPGLAPRRGGHVPTLQCLGSRISSRALWPVGNCVVFTGRWRWGECLGHSLRGFHVPLLCLSGATLSWWVPNHHD